jgi:hypothetical protein
MPAMARGPNRRFGLEQSRHPDQFLAHLSQPARVRGPAKRPWLLDSKREKPIFCFFPKVQANRRSFFPASIKIFVLESEN